MDTEDYSELQNSSSSVIDISEDFDKFRINEYEDPTTKSYHCAAKRHMSNETFVPDPELVKYLDSNSFLAIRPRKNYYQVRQVRQKLCEYGFDPFHPDNKVGSIHKRFKNTLRLMIYNTPGMFPGLRVVRNDLDRKRKREPQTWFKFESAHGPLTSEFDYDNYFVTINGDLTRIQALSKLLVAFKMHKRLNNFDDAVSHKVNLDLGIAEMIVTIFGSWIIKDKSWADELVIALNGIRTKIVSAESNEVRLEFEESLKEAAERVDPVLYLYIWLLSMAELYEPVRLRDTRTSSNQPVGNLSQMQHQRIHRNTFSY